MLSVPHLDREFDYLVTAEQSDDAQPGVRVRVRFHGRLVDAFILERRSETDHVGKLGWLDRVVSAERVLTPDVRRLVDAVAARYAGTRADVLRLAVPPRHANVEKETARRTRTADCRLRRHGAVGRVRQGRRSFSPPFARAAPPGRSGRRLPGERWADRLAEVAAATVERRTRGAGDRARPARRRRAARTPPSGSSTRGRVVALVGGARARAALPALAVGAARSARLVIGTRSAVFAPVADLGLVLVWDDGDDTLAEPRAPYPHAREVGDAARPPIALCRNDRRLLPHRRGAGAWCAAGWAHDLVAARPVVRARAPRVIALEDSGYAHERDPAAHTRPAAVDGAAGRAVGAGRRPSRAGPGAAQGIRPRAGLRPVPHHRPLQALHRPAVAA